jgi:hypothetical protein
VFYSDVTQDMSLIAPLQRYSAIARRAKSARSIAGLMRIEGKFITVYHYSI